MPGFAIVAIPRSEDSVWKYSSEKVPHMTMLFLGDQLGSESSSRIAGYLSHVASTTLQPFLMAVKSRGDLGPDKADVLFFEKNRMGFQIVDNARNYLLTNSDIREAYDSTPQYPEWTPHLTMGYPDTPAKKDDRDYPGFSYVEFDRVALWTDDFAGIEFKLEYPESEATNMDMLMAERTEVFLEHFGVMGMHWGRRMAEKSVPAGETKVTQKKPGTKVVSEGGKHVPAHPDAMQAAASKQRAKSSTTDALSTKELQDLVTRMNLEQQYSKLSAGQTSAGRKFVNDLLMNTVKQQGTKIINEQAGKLVEDAMKKKANRG